MITVIFIEQDIDKSGILSKFELVLFQNGKKRLDFKYRYISLLVGYSFEVISW